MVLMVSKVEDGEWSGSIGADRNQVKLGRHGMRTVLEGFSHKGN